MGEVQGRSWRSRPGTIVTVVALIAFVVLVAWSMRGVQRAECEACVSYAGRGNCAVASAASEGEAARSAQATACGILASGMNESIACERTPPTALRCRTR